MNRKVFILVSLSKYRRSRLSSLAASEDSQSVDIVHIMLANLPRLLINLSASSELPNFRILLLRLANYFSEQRQDGGEGSWGCHGTQPLLKVCPGQLRGQRSD